MRLKKVKFRGLSSDIDMSVDKHMFVKDTLWSKIRPMKANKEKAQYLVLGQFNEYGKEFNNKQSNMTPRFICFESDNISLEDQEKVIDELMKSELRNNIYTITFSGNKSFHVLILIEPNKINTKDKYLYCRKVIFKKYNIDGYADPQVCNYAGTTRMPNGTRINSDGTTSEQTCVYCNPDVVPYDCSEIAENYVSYKARKDKVEEKRAKKLKEWLEKHKDDIKDPAEELARLSGKNQKWKTIYDRYNSYIKSPSDGTAFSLMMTLFKRFQSHMDFCRIIYEEFKRDHPSTLPQKFEQVWKRI